MLLPVRIRGAWRRLYLPLCCCLALLASDCMHTDGECGADPLCAASKGTASFAVTCDAMLEAYPVHGPHNGGWDANWDNFTCPPHPDSSPDNSDFIAGDHYGNDIFAERGTPVVAARSGRVVFSGWDSIGGWAVSIVDECGWWTYYAHLDSASPLAEGADISAGDEIGPLGNSGNASGTAPHLHFSIFPDGQYTSGINPFSLLQTVDHTSCAEPCECTEGEEDVRDCLDCGSQTRLCGADDCTWGEWSACEGPDPDGGTRVCETDLPGACREGRERCLGGVLECVAVAEPSEELCDGIDNDCDGETDEDCTGDAADAVPDGGEADGPPDTVVSDDGTEADGAEGTGVAGIEGGCGCATVY